MYYPKNCTFSWMQYISKTKIIRTNKISISFKHHDRHFWGCLESQLTIVAFSIDMTNFELKGNNEETPNICCYLF